MKIYFYLFLLCLGPWMTYAQVGIGNTNPNPNALLEIGDGTDSGGIILPRVALSNLISFSPLTSHIEGMIVYNTSDTEDVSPGFYYNDGACWCRINADTTTAWATTGNAGTTASTNFLGTTDEIDLVLATNNTTALTINTEQRLLASNLGTKNSPTYSFDGDDNIGMWTSGNDKLNFSAGGREFLELLEGSNDELRINDGGVDIDFRVESEDEAHMIFMDAGTNRIGIRTATPNSFFQMTNGGVNVGANAAMARYDNSGSSGVALLGYNLGTTNGYNGIEGITAGTYSGVYGLGISQDNGSSFDATGVYGHANDLQGIGVLGIRASTGGGSDSGYGGLFQNDLGYTGGFYNASDKRLKKEIATIKNSLDIVKQLNPVKYYYDTEKYPFLGLNTGLEYGFIAQELEEVLPNLVKEKKLDKNATQKTGLNSDNFSQDNEIFKMVDYTRIIPLLTKSIQEQQNIIEEQNARITALENLVLGIIRKSNK